MIETFLLLCNLVLVHSEKITKRFPIRNKGSRESQMRGLREGEAFPRCNWQSNFLERVILPTR